MAISLMGFGIWMLVRQVNNLVDHTPEVKYAENGRFRGSQMYRMFLRMKEAVYEQNPTEEQIRQVDTIVASANKEIGQLMDTIKVDMDSDDRARMIKETLDKYHQKFADILTPDQRTKYTEIMDRATDAPGGQAPTDPGTLLLILSGFANATHLSDAQLDKVEMIIAKAQNDFDAQVWTQDTHRKNMEIVRSSAKQVGTILSPAQLSKLKDEIRSMGAPPGMNPLDVLNSDDDESPTPPASQAPQADSPGA
jgi:hypothetical protein